MNKKKKKKKYFERDYKLINFFYFIYYIFKLFKNLFLTTIIWIKTIYIYIYKYSFTSKFIIYIIVFTSFIIY